MPDRLESFELEEYKALRVEIQKRSEFQQQFINYALIITGAFFTLGAQANVPGWVVFMHPVLIAAFAMAWLDHDAFIQRISHYLQTMEAGRSSTWEQSLKTPRQGTPDWYKRWMTKGGATWRGDDYGFVWVRIVFVGTQVAAIALGIQKSVVPWIVGVAEEQTFWLLHLYELVFLLIALGAAVFTFRIIWRR